MKTNNLIFDITTSGVYFGQSVALNNKNLAFIGAHRYQNSGTVYGYKLYDTEWNWNEIIKINSNNQQINEGFGFSVATNNKGNTLAIGAPFKNRYDGVVYIFTGNNTEWKEAYQISGTLSGLESFGYNIHLNQNGDHLIIGTNIYNSSTGKAYLYSGNGNTWNLITSFIENDGILRLNNKYKTYYGNKVAINSGNTVLIGSALNNYSGAIFIYTGNGNTWIKSQKLTGTNNSLFGENFYISENSNYITVGAPNSFNKSGAIYVYEKNNNFWDFKNLITGNTTNLGKCLFINESGNFIFASENSYSGAINNYIRTGNNWYKNLTIKNPNPYGIQYFGNNFVVNNNYNNLLIGTPNFDYFKGTAYIYTKPWNDFKEYYAINEYDISGAYCYCDKFLTCQDCCGVIPSFEIKTGYFNNLNQFSAEIDISIRNNNCSPIYDIFKIYSNGIKIYNNIYHAKSLTRKYNETINLKNIKPINNLINLELKAYCFGKDYSYSSGIDINNY